MVGAERTELSSSSIEVGTSSLGHVSVWAINIFALVNNVRVVIVEATEPQSAGIESKRPFTNPDVILDVSGSTKTVLVVIAVSFSRAHITVPSLIEMGIHNNLVNIIISEHTVPAGAVVKSVVENEGNLRGFLLDHGSGVLIEFNQCISWGVPPWLIDWLKSVESRVRTPSIEELADIVESPVDVILVNVIIAVFCDVPVTDPVGGLDLPMAEVVVINPLEI